jgi:hypothetical protein
VCRIGGRLRGWGRLHCCLVGVVGGWGRGSSPFLKKQKTNYTIPEFLRPSMAGPRGTGGGSRLVIIRPQQLVTVTGDNFAPVHSALGPNTGQTRNFTALRTAARVMPHRDD